MSWPIPFKIVIPRRGCVGIVAYNYNHLRQVIAHKYGVGYDFVLQQGDGTLVCDEEYLQLLKPRTPLIVVPFAVPSRAGASLGAKRRAQTQPYASSTPRQKQPRLEQLPTPFHAPNGQCNVQGRSSMHPLAQAPSLHAQNPAAAQRCNPALCTHNAALPARTQLQCHPSTSSNSASLVSQLQITSVMGNVSMNSSPPRPVLVTQPPTNLLSESSSSILGEYPQMPRLTPMFHVPGTHTPAPVPYHQPLQAQAAVPQHAYVPKGVHNVQCYERNPSDSSFLPHPVSAHHTQQKWQPQALRVAAPRVYSMASPTLQLAGSALEEYQRDLAQLQESVRMHRWKQQQAHQTRRQPVPPLLLVPPSANTPPPVAVSTTTTVPSSLLHSLEQHRKGVECTQITVSEVAPITYLQSPNITSPPPPESDDSVWKSSEDADPTSPTFSLQLPPTPLQVPSTLVQAPTSEPAVSIPVPAEPTLEPFDAVSSNKSGTTETEKITTVAVVSCPTNDLLFSESECDEDDDNKLCIVEQACPPSPEPPTTHHEEAHLKRRNKPAALCLTPFTVSPRQSLGDAKYPIVLDPDAVGHSEAADTCFADEGYSSSSSPYDITEDYSSQLPFANYDGANTVTEVEEEEKNLDDWNEELSQGDAEVQRSARQTCERLMTAEVPNTDNGEGQVVCEAVEHIGGAAEDEDYAEEDFVMDVDVFLPFSSSQIQCPKQPPLPDYLPLELHAEPDVESGVHSDEESELKVSIARDSLSDIWSPQNSISSPLSGLAPKYKHKRRQRKHRHRSSGTDDLNSPPNNVPLSRPASLMVHVPISHYNHGHTECLMPKEDDSEDSSDEPSTTMELLASKLEQTREVKRVPRIIRLESYYQEMAEPIVEVAEYSNEVNVLSVCSIDDMNACLNELSDLCNRTNSIGGGDATPLNVGSEIELGELSQESGSTGMELLNLRNEQRPHLPTATTEVTCSHSTQQCTYTFTTSTSRVHSENLFPEQERLIKPKSWKVRTLVRDAGCVSDPRHRVQRYSLGGVPLFELAYTAGRWKLSNL